MAEQLPQPPPMPIQGFKDLKDTEKWAKTMTLYLDSLRQRVGKLL